MRLGSPHRNVVRVNVRRDVSLEGRKADKLERLPFSGVVAPAITGWSRRAYQSATAGIGEKVPS